MNKYLITAPFSQQGGVASFVNNIVPYLSISPIIFKRGYISSKNYLVRYFNSLILPFRFIAAIYKTNAQCILVNSSLSCSLMLRDGLLVRLSKAMHRKTILFIHGFREEDLKYRKLLQWGYFKADRIIVLASEFKNLLINVGYKNNIVVSLNPINENILKQTINNKRHIIDSHNILYLSRIEKNKGIFEAVECFNIIKQKHPELVFNILGDGTAKKDAEQYVIDNDIKNVIFHGFVTGQEKINLLNNSLLLLLLSSHREGLPISVLEAMSAGLIILTRPIGGLKDLYEQCNFGVLIESTSHQDFADAFEKYYNNPDLLQKTSQNNKIFSSSHFSPKIIAQNIENLFASI